MSATVKRFRKSGRRLEALLAGHFSVLEWPPLSYYQRYFNIMQTKAQYNTKSFQWKFDYSPWKILPKFLVGGFNFDQMPKGTPNIFVGTLVLIGFICYFTCKEIKLKEKIATIVVSAFFVVSLCYQPLDLFWHAMQFPVWYPYRFSYIVCFWMILIAARGLLKITRLSPVTVDAQCHCSRGDRRIQLLQR